MLWDELTGDRFTDAVREAQGVCLLPLSCLERHGHHLPLNTDLLIARAVCRRAADLEPAVVYPDFFYTQILEARHAPGCIGLDPDLVIRLLDNVCREIARNGLKKIVLVNAHGGNDALLGYFIQIQLASRRDYVVYATRPPYAEQEAESGLPWETTIDGHAGERETSIIQALRPDLVDEDAMPSDGEGMPLGRLQSLRDLGVNTGTCWYGNHPTHYCGDGRPASADRGERWLEITARALAKAIRAIKDDTQAKRLQDEFFGRLEQR